MVSKPLTRRTILGAGFATMSGGSFNIAQSVRAQSAATFHRFKWGTFEITIVTDGIMEIPTRSVTRDQQPGDVAATLIKAGLDGALIRQPTNITFVRSATELIAIDVGAGPNFMSTLGKLPENLAAAGIDPNAVTKVVFTHGHPDHLWGAVDEFDDSPRFSRASYVFSEQELDMWRSADAESKLPADRANFVPGARRNIKALGDKISTIKPGQDIITGLTAIETFGHSQGHIAIAIAGETEQLFVLGDALTHPIISFAHPDWQLAADHEPERAVVTRRKLLDRLASDRAMVVGFHLPFPGIGRVEKMSAGYRLVM